MSAPPPLQSDSEMRFALAALTVAEEVNAVALSDCVIAAQRAAAVLTDKELRQWTAGTAKLWQAQADLAGRHGAMWNDNHVGKSVARSQLRHSWLGNLTGLALPLALAGGTVLDHGFLLPVFWMAALSADLGGRATCLHRARILRTPQTTIHPGTISMNVRRALTNAREYGDWSIAWPEVQQLKALDESVQQRDRDLKLTRRFGKRVGVLSLLVFLAALVMLRTDWTLLPLSLIAVFGTACLLTSNSYSGVVEQPPYPRQGSVQRIQHNVHYESLLARTPPRSFANLDLIEQHTTDAMRKQRAFMRALKDAKRAAEALEDARWKVAILKAERGAVS